MRDTTMGRRRHVIRIEYTLSEVPGRGWLAHAAAIRATAQGDTQEEAYRNLRQLVERYPEVLDEVKREAPELELVAV